MGLCNPIAHADALKLEDLIKLDIVDLGKIKVTVASKREESAADAPAVLTIVTAQDIKKYGAKNLQDILNRTTSIQGVGSHFYSNSVSIRGQMVAHSNNDVLFLVNGRPYRTSWNGGTAERILLGFPVGTIERIEIIRGPGSVLYGTEAFTGVINIITKTAAQLTDTQASVTYGSFKTRALNVDGGMQDGKLEITSGLRLYRSNGWAFTATDEAGITQTVDRGEKDLGGMLSLKYSDLSMEVLYTDVNLDNIMGGPPVWPAGYHNTKHMLADLGYQYHIDNNWSVDNHLTYNKFDFLFVDTPPQVNNRDSRDTLVESTLSGKVSEKSDLLIGLTYERIKGTISPVLDYSSYRYSVYGQADYALRKDLKFIAGIQWNKVEFTDGDYSPRLGLIEKFDNHFGMKLLYGQAFRSAVSTERFLTTGGVIGDPALDPEKIATTELQFFYTDDASFAALTIFRSVMRDVIDRVQIGGTGPLYFVNVNEVTSHGVELEGKRALTKGFNINGSLLYQTNEDTSGKDASLAPSYMVKIGVDHESKNGITLGVFDAYFAKPTPVREVNVSVNEYNPEPAAYHLLTAKISVNLNEVLQKSKKPNMTFALFFDNLLDEDIYYPEINRHRINSIPIYSGRAVYATLEAKY